MRLSGLWEEVARFLSLHLWPRGNLDDRTALVLRMRSGMLDGQLYMLREVGEEIGVKGERVRQIQNQGLVRMRGFREVQRHMASKVKARRDHSGKPDMHRGSHPTRQTSLLKGRHPEPSREQPPPVKDSASTAANTSASLLALGEAVKWEGSPGYRVASEQAPNPRRQAAREALAVGDDETQVCGDCPFPGWESFVPQFIHPLKVAIVEALLWIEEPLSAVQFGKMFGSAGQGFRESNVRYHLKHLADAGVLESTSEGDRRPGNPKQIRFYFARSSTLCTSEVGRPQ